MDKEQTRQILEAALSKFIQTDLHSDAGFPVDISERSIMFRLAYYLIESGAEDSGLRVDCEYNRHINAVKTMLPKKKETLLAGGGKVRPQRFFPDIVLHERRSDRHNLLVCEIKRTDDRRSRKIDRCRLEELTRRGGEYGYDFGAFLEINQAERWIAVTYFQDGSPTDTTTIRH